MKRIKIKVVTKAEFTELLEESWLYNNKDYTQKDIFSYLTSYGFPKLDWENLSKCLPEMDIYLKTVAVDFGDSLFYWVVSGRSAMLINKSDVE
jgi:hypothetical protein